MLLIAKVSRIGSKNYPPFVELSTLVHAKDRLRNQTVPIAGPPHA